MQPVRVIAAGLEAVGAVSSTVLIKFWVTLIVFPQASVTLYVLIIVSVQSTKAGALSPTKATIGVEQASASSVTTEISASGKVPLQPVIVMAAGLEAVGAVVSSIFIVWLAVPILPHASVTVHVLLIILFPGHETGVKQILLNSILPLTLACFLE